MLSFDWQIDGEYVGIKYIVERVNLLKVRERIIQNLNEGKIRSEIFVNHVKYCIENNIDECVGSIGKYLLKKTNYFEERRICVQYLLKHIEMDEFVAEYLNKKNKKLEI